MSKSVRDWINGKTAAEALGCYRHNLAKIAAAEGVRVYRLPNTHPRYYRPDVEALARRCVVNGPAPELAGSK